jgi:hypothetical protein
VATRAGSNRRYPAPSTPSRLRVRLRGDFLIDPRVRESRRRRVGHAGRDARISSSSSRLTISPALNSRSGRTRGRMRARWHRATSSRDRRCEAAVITLGGGGGIMKITAHDAGPRMTISPSTSWPAGPPSCQMAISWPGSGGPTDVRRPKHPAVMVVALHSPGRGRKSWSLQQLNGPQPEAALDLMCDRGRKRGRG